MIVKPFTIFNCFNTIFGMLVSFIISSLLLKSNKISCLSKTKNGSCGAVFLPKIEILTLPLLFNKKSNAGSITIILSNLLTLIEL